MSIVSPLGVLMICTYMDGTMVDVDIHVSAGEKLQLQNLIH